MRHPFLRQLLKALQLLVFLGALVAIAYLLKKDFEAESLRIMLKAAQWHWLAGALLIALAGLVIKAVRLKDLAANFQFHPSLMQSFYIQVISISLGIITPGRSGELSKMFLLSADLPRRRGTAFWVMLIERLLDLIILAGFACLFLFSLPWVLGIAVLGVALLACIGWGIQRYPQQALVQRLAPLQHLKPLTLIRVVILSAVAWVLDGIFQWCILAGIGAFLSPLMTVGINAVVAIAGIFSLLPIGLGTVDLSALVLYQHSGGLSSEEVVFLLGAGRILGLGLLFTLFGLVFLQKPQMLAFRKTQAFKKTESTGDEELESLRDKA